MKVNSKSRNAEQVFVTLYVTDRGTLVIIHGNTLHKSEANRSKKSRYIYTFHIIEGLATYDSKNWY